MHAMIITTSVVVIILLKICKRFRCGVELDIIGMSTITQTDSLSIVRFCKWTRSKLIFYSRKKSKASRHYLTHNSYGLQTKVLLKIEYLN